MDQGQPRVRSPLRAHSSSRKLSTPTLPAYARYAHHSITYSIGSLSLSLFLSRSLSLSLSLSLEPSAPFIFAGHVANSCPCRVRGQLALTQPRRMVVPSHSIEGEDNELNIGTAWVDMLASKIASGVKRGFNTRNFEFYFLPLLAEDYIRVVCSLTLRLE